MFTGLVQTKGRILRVEPAANTAQAGLKLCIEPGSLNPDQLSLGASVAIQGACMTVVAYEQGQFSVVVSAESLRCTVGLDKPGWVNLESSLTLATPLGGHLVSGHVDGLGTVVELAAIGESWLFRVQVPAKLAKYMAVKGSVAIQGVSLTVNAVADQADGSCIISINLIPHTFDATTLGLLQAGDQVNLEVDQLARYCERLLQPFMQHS